MEFSQAFSISRSLSAAWKILFRAPGALLLGGVLLVLLESPFAINFRLDRFDWDRVWPLAIVIGMMACFLGLFFFLARCWIEVGFANAVELAARTGEERVAAVFDAKNRWLSMALAHLLTGVLIVLSFLPVLPVILFAVFLHEVLDAPEELAVAAGIAGGVLCVPIVLYVGLGLALVAPAVALEGLDPFAAIRRSWSLVRGNRVWLFIYALVLSCVGLVGVCLCCVGIFFTETLVRVAWNESYLALTRGGEHARWWVSTSVPAAPAPPPAPPPPPAPAAPPAAPAA